MQDQRQVRDLAAERAKGGQDALARGVAEIRHDRVHVALGDQPQECPDALTEAHCGECPIWSAVGSELEGLEFGCSGGRHCALVWRRRVPGGKGLKRGPPPARPTGAPP